MTAPRAAPAVFNALISIVQSVQVPIRTLADQLRPIPNSFGRFRQSLLRMSPEKRPKIVVGSVKLCDLWHSSRQGRDTDFQVQRYCDEQAGRICGHIEDESDVRGSGR